MDNNRVKIYSYTKVWKVEKKIYSFGNLILPIPLNPFDLLAYAGVALCVLILGKIFPALNYIPAIIRYIAMPYLIAKYFMKVKLDGKNPFLFLLGYLKYIFSTRWSYLQNFKRHPDKKTEHISFSWNCSMGTRN